MIFKSVNQINSKADKAFFEELIGVYCKIVREVCNIHSLGHKPCPTEVTEAITSELVSMGVIDDKNQLEQLKKLLKGEYNTFIYGVNKYLDNKAIFVVAGAPACADELKAAGIENFIHVKVNQLDTLKAFNAKLGI